MTSEEVTSRRPRQFIFVAENLLLIYFDSNLHKNNELLCRCHDTFPFPIRTFDEVDPCIDYLTDLTDQIILILRNTSYETLVPLIDDLPHLTRIYIVHEKMTEQEDWMKMWKKIEIISTDATRMFDQFHRHIRQVNEISVPISIAKSPSPTNLNELDPSFMYSLLLKESILKMKYDENAKKLFVDFCRENAATWMVSSTKIDDFERDYSPESALWWYTKESFIYSTLNHALRTQDIDAIMNMDFYIQDLHRQLEKHRSNAEQNTAMILY